jgi:hypothetical protein
MPAHGFPSRSNDRTTRHRAAAASRGRWVLPALLCAALALLLAVAAGLWWGVGLSWNAMVRSDAPVHARWTLVLDGWVPRGERAARGLALARAGMTDSVLVSGTNIAPGLWGSTLQILALHPEPALAGRVAELRHQANSTIEESRHAIAFFRSRGVDTILLVTSDYHSDRAASIFAKLAEGRPVALSVPAVEARFAAGWDRERRKTWLLEATKRVHWGLYERWVLPVADSSTASSWTAVLGAEAGTSPLFRNSCPPAPVCPPAVICPVCPTIPEPVATPCPEPKATKAEAKPAAKKAEEPKKTSAKAKESAKTGKKTSKKR